MMEGDEATGDQRSKSPMRTLARIASAPFGGPRNDTTLGLHHLQIPAQSIRQAHLLGGTAIGKEEPIGGDEDD
jgi:hypothetical protein